MKSKKTLKKPSGPAYSSDQLDKTLLDVEDVMGRALLPFVLLGQTAKDVLDNVKLSSEVTIGIQRKHLTKEAVSTLRTYLKLDPNKSFSYEPAGHPRWTTMPRVHVKIIEKKWGFLENQDFKFYMAGEYKIPNPFETYWKARGLVR